MDRAVLSLIEGSIEAAEQQLAAAKSLDLDGLKQATERRQDLNFELSLVKLTPADIQEFPELRDLLSQLDLLDRRLTNVLGAAGEVFSALLPTSSPVTYAADGKLRGRYA
jgi:negative regulator of sigma E activity